MAFYQPPRRCRNLVLDAGPLLSLSPLRGLADKYYTVPQVLAELKDKRAQDHFERLGLQAGVHIQVRSPDAASLAHVIQFAKSTGDYPVLSHVDLSLIALTHALHEQAKAEGKRVSEMTAVLDEGTIPSAVPVDETVSRADALQGVSLEDTPESTDSQPVSSVCEHTQEQNNDQSGDVLPQSDDELLNRESANPTLPVVELATPEDGPIPYIAENPDPSSESPIFEDPSDSDDGEGEWITPSNAALHKSRALEMLPVSEQRSKANADTVIDVGCMTTDFAMQNVLLQMGLNLVNVEGKRIEKLKTWVLRCHACFKICKDPSKKFCPSCGNPTLLRTSVTISAPGASGEAPAMQVHLKKNFQYKNRGTVYSIPSPKPGSAKTGPGEGLILREDQLEYMRAKKRVDAKRERDERKMVKGLFAPGSENGVNVGSWMDPDWIPEMMSTSSGGKGRKMRNGTSDELPVIGFGRKNPNERKRRT